MNNANVCCESELKLNGWLKLLQTNRSPVTSKMCRATKVFFFSLAYLADLMWKEVYVSEMVDILLCGSNSGRCVCHTLPSVVLFTAQATTVPETHTKCTWAKGSWAFRFSPPSDALKRPLACYAMRTFMWVVRSLFSDVHQPRKGS